MHLYPQAVGNDFSGLPDRHSPDSGGGGLEGPLGAFFRNGTHTQGFSEPLVAPQDLFPVQQIVNPHTVSRLRRGGILGRNALLSEQLQVMLRRRHAYVEARGHFAPRRRSILG